VLLLYVLHCSTIKKIITVNNGPDGRSDVTRRNSFAEGERPRIARFEHGLYRGMSALGRLLYCGAFCGTGDPGSGGANEPVELSAGTAALTDDKSKHSSPYSRPRRRNCYRLAEVCGACFSGCRINFCKRQFRSSATKIVFSDGQAISWIQPNSFGCRPVLPRTPTTLPSSVIL
jgi:hypothetical protein